MQCKDNVFQSLWKLIPEKEFQAIIAKYQGDKWIKKYGCSDLLKTLLHFQLLGEKSLRKLVISQIGLAKGGLQLGMTGYSRSSLSEAMQRRSAEVFTDLGYLLMEQIAGKVKREIHALLAIIDSSPIQLNADDFHWAQGNRRINGLKLHLLYESKGNCPLHFSLTHPNVNDIEEAKKLPIVANSTYTFDKAYYDFKWWAKLHASNCRFVTRLKKGIVYNVIKRQPKPTNQIIKDWIIQPTARRGKQFKHFLRCIRVRIEGNRSIVLLTNDLHSSAIEIADIYKSRWQIELLFKWIKQNLKIKRFIGKSENAVKIQIASAIILFLLLRLLKLYSQSPYSMSEIKVLVASVLYQRLCLLHILSGVGEKEHICRFSVVTKKHKCSNFTGH